MKALFSLLIVLFLQSQVIELTAQSDIIPSSPYEGEAAVFATDLAYYSNEQGQTTKLNWKINGATAKAAQTINTFRLSFEEGLSPQEGDTALESEGATIVSGKFGHALRMTNGRLAYPSKDRISFKAGSLSMWIALDQDISTGNYQETSYFFENRQDDDNVINLSASSRRIFSAAWQAGTNRITWPDFTPFKKEVWHHIVWTWDEETNQQQLFLDGRNISHPNWEYKAPEIESESFVIGTDWWGNHPPAAMMDEIRLFNKALSQDEVGVLYKFPEKDLDALLEPTFFKKGDELTLEYQYFNGTELQSIETLGPWIVSDAPMGEIIPGSQLLPAGTDNLSFVVNTLEDAICRCDTTQNDFANMAFQMESTDQRTHSFAMPGQEDYPYQVYVQCGSPNQEPWSIIRKVNYRILRPFNPSYPRILGFGDRFDSENDSPSILSKFDLVAFYRVNLTQEKAKAARKLNPDLKFLNGYDFCYGGYEDALFQAANNNPNDPLFNSVLSQADGTILIEPFWQHTFYNLANPACVDYVAELMINRWEYDLMAYDGIYFDRVQPSVSGEFSGIDIDRDGIVDSATKVDSLWDIGVKRLLTLLREDIPNAYIVGNSAKPEYNQWLSGLHFENQLLWHYDFRTDFRSFWDEYRNWDRGDASPNILTMQGPHRLWEKYGTDPASTIEMDTITFVQEQYQRMRYSLGLTLLGNGFYHYEFGTTWWTNDWWYDEYDAPLGYPLSSAFIFSSTGGEWSVSHGFENNNLGSYLDPSNQNTVAVTSSESEVISGSHSLKASNLDPNSSWLEFLWSDLSQVELKPNTEYKISWKYKIIKEAEHGFYYAAIRSGAWPDAVFDLWGTDWDPPAGTVDSLSFLIRTDDRTDYYLLFGMLNDGVIVLDDIEIQESANSVWRRNFDNGVILVNQGPDTVSVALESMYYALDGIQDPIINHGLLIGDSIVIPPRDSRLLLNQVVSSTEKFAPSDNLNELLIFPNPFTNKLNIQFSLQKTEDLKVSIKDLMGRNMSIIFEGRLGPGDHRLSWHKKENLPAGLYVVNILNENGRTTSQLLLMAD